MMESTVGEVLCESRREVTRHPFASVAFQGCLRDHVRGLGAYLICLPEPMTVDNVSLHLCSSIHSKLQAWGEEDWLWFRNTPAVTNCMRLAAMAGCNAHREIAHANANGVLG